MNFLIGVIFSFVIAFNFDRVWNSRFVNGEMDASRVFWKYGALGLLLVMIFGFFYLVLLNCEQMYANPLSGGCVAVLGFLAATYCFFFIVANWNSSKKVETWKKILFRWLSLNHILCFVLGVYAGKLYFILSVIIYYYDRKKNLKDKLARKYLNNVFARKFLENRFVRKFLNKMDNL
ncbi:hypothetical protein [Endozoicomonas acroporae]|uniref:hypothetical protein n=1 Tax=Endozoicomonas acroporae TaxID=1701104 RepID=UPI003D7A4689